MTNDAVILGRLLAAAVLGGAIGFERELHGRSAGLRTHILVCLGSALIMLTAEHLFYAYQGLASLDPGRFAAQVVSGIGFLGAGTILQSRASVRGLTTAAGLWAAAGIGLAAGAGFHVGAIGATALVLVTLYALTRWEWAWLRKSRFKSLTIYATGPIALLGSIRTTLARSGAEVQDFEVQRRDEQVVLQLAVRLSMARQEDIIPQALMGLPGVSRVVWGSGS
ncbi:MAG: MgtC/SapB family protein [Candidatus Omnitrophica bacterium]|nr:MgtC/SapB family protein [Candidatus Omnitrophota bacterium]